MEEHFYTIALTLIPGLGLAGKRQLLKMAGNAKTLFENRQEWSKQMAPHSKRIVGLLDCPAAFKRAEEEMTFIEKHQIRCLTLFDEDYPSRLRECDDAPIVLYYKGNADLFDDRTSFRDETHLNGESAKVFSELFAREVLGKNREEVSIKDRFYTDYADYRNHSVYSIRPR